MLRAPPPRPAPSRADMLTATLLLLGSVLLALALLEPLVRQLPLSPALVYLAVGWVAGAALGAPSLDVLLRHAPELMVATELAVLVSLVAVALQLRVPPAPGSWRVALWLASAGLVVAVVLATPVAMALLGVAAPAALMLAAVMAPTDPVLAAEVRIRHEHDRDAVRLSLTAEGGLNDGTALPAVTLALAWLGLHDPGEWGLRWLARDVLWAVGGGALLGVLLGRVLARLLQILLQRGEHLMRDELLFVGIVTLAYGLARATHTSAFIVAFAAGASLLWPWGRQPVTRDGRAAAAERLHAFGSRLERLIEAVTVLAVGLALHGLAPGWRDIAFGVVLALAVRPLAVLAVVRRATLPRSQRRLLAWFGIRGVGTLYYLAWVLTQGVDRSTAQAVVPAALAAVAVSVVLHGVSATPVMAAYQRRRAGTRGEP